MLKSMSASRPSLTELRNKLKRLASPARAKIFLRFFKTGPGEYGEGDQFLGITVPELRTTAKTFKDLAYSDVLTLLRSIWHEERLIALYFLIQRFEKGDEAEKTKIYQDYLANTKHINNWDLVDTSAAQIVGGYLNTQSKPIIRETLQTLAGSSSLWERRIAIVTTLYWIRRKDHSETFTIARQLLIDKQDLIHKAIGWMLREVGKYSGEEVLRGFLDEYGHQLPRTSLRYAIERLPPIARRNYLITTKTKHKKTA